MNINFRDYGRDQMKLNNRMINILILFNRKCLKLLVIRDLKKLENIYHCLDQMLRRNMQEIIYIKLGNLLLTKMKSLRNIIILENIYVLMKV